MTKMHGMSDTPLTEANLRKAMADLAARPVDPVAYHKLRSGAETMLFHDRDPGDEEPEPDYMKLINDAIDVALKAQHPRGADGSS